MFRAGFLERRAGHGRRAALNGESGASPDGGLTSKTTSALVAAGKELLA